jgi:hypothetical protein
MQVERLPLIESEEMTVESRVAPGLALLKLSEFQLIERVQDDNLTITLSAAFEIPTKTQIWVAQWSEWRMDHMKYRGRVWRKGRIGLIGDQVLTERSEKRVVETSGVFEVPRRKIHLSIMRSQEYPIRMAYQGGGMFIWPKMNSTQAKGCEAILDRAEPAMTATRAETHADRPVVMAFGKEIPIARIFGAPPEQVKPATEATRAETQADRPVVMAFGKEIPIARVFGAPPEQVKPAAQSLRMAYSGGAKFIWPKESRTTQAEKPAVQGGEASL